MAANKAKQALDGSQIEGKFLRVIVGLKEASTLVNVEESESSGDERRERNNEDNIEGLSNRYVLH